MCDYNVNSFTLVCFSVVCNEFSVYRELQFSACITYTSVNVAPNRQYSSYGASETEHSCGRLGFSVSPN